MPPPTPIHRYAIGLGSNRARGRGRAPRATVAEALAALSGLGTAVVAASTIESAALGPGGRRYANAAMLLDTALPPPALLGRLKAIERAMGRRPGQRWGARTIDLDILLWSGGAWVSRGPALAIPHAGLAVRGFVLGPLADIAPGWRVPGAGGTVRHLAARLTRAGRLPRGGFRAAAG